MNIFRDEYGDVRPIWIALLVVVLMGTLVFGGVWSNENGVRINTNNWDAHEAPKELDIPVKVVGSVEYRSNIIYSKEKWVNYCDVKEAKKELRKEMRGVWKELKGGCK